MACGACGGPGHNKLTCQGEGNPPKRAPKRKPKTNGTEVAKAGRPLEHDYFDIFSTLDEPPDDPAERESWVQGIMCVALRETLQGRGNLVLNDQIRHMGGAIQKLTKRERIWGAERIIKGDRLKKKPKASGPTTQKARKSPGPLRK